MPRTIGAVLVLCLLAAPVVRGDDGDWRDRVTLIASERLRGEFVDWFRPRPRTAAPDVHRYSFIASQLRAGLSVVLPHVQLTLVAQDTRLGNLPDDASLAPPVGNLGPGAVYYANTKQRTQGEPFLKLGFLTLRRAGLAATVGRYEYRDGLETVPGDPALSALKRTRIAERLVGPFEFTHVTRSFDGVRLACDRPGWNVTVIGTRPTQGGFEVSANRELDLTLAGAALTLKLLPAARTYAQLPFYNLMNTAVAFAQVLLVPHRIVSLRADYHWLTSSVGNVIWYSGGGATNDHVFGYAGSPAGGRHALAQVIDLSVTVQLLRQLALGTYYGHAFGGDVVRETFAGTGANYGFVELVYRR